MGKDILLPIYLCLECLKRMLCVALMHKRGYKVIDSQAVNGGAEVIAVFTAHDLHPIFPPIPMRLTPARELEDALQIPWQVILYVMQVSQLPSL